MKMRGIMLYAVMVYFENDQLWIKTMISLSLYMLQGYMYVKRFKFDSRADYLTIFHP